MVEARMLTMTKLSTYYKIKYVKTEEHSSKIKQQETTLGVNRL